MGEVVPVLYVARHGETAWSLSGQHTGLTDFPLTPNGERNAKRLGERLKGLTFTKVFTSPLQRVQNVQAGGIWKRGRDRSRPSGMGLRSIWRAALGRDICGTPRRATIPGRMPGRRIPSKLRRGRTESCSVSGQCWVTCCYFRADISSEFWLRDGWSSAWGLRASIFFSVRQV